MLQLGSSKHWTEAMKLMTGKPDMDTSAFVEYFSPLEKWLSKYNEKNNNHVSVWMYNMLPP